MQCEESYGIPPPHSAAFPYQSIAETSFPFPNSGEHSVNDFVSLTEAENYAQC